METPDQTEGNFQYATDEIVDPGPEVFSMAVEVHEERLAALVNAAPGSRSLNRRHVGHRNADDADRLVTARCLRRRATMVASRCSCVISLSYRRTSAARRRFRPTEQATPRCAHQYASTMTRERRVVAIRRSISR